MFILPVPQRGPADGQINSSCKFRHASATALLRTLHWLSVKARIQYKIACHCFQCIYQDSMPPYIFDLLHPYCPYRTLRSLDTSLLTVPRFSLETFGSLICMCSGFLFVCLFFICPCSAQLSMFHMEWRSRNTLIIIIIIIIIIINVLYHTVPHKLCRFELKDMHGLPLLTYALRSGRSIGHLRPLTIALCSGLLWSFQTSWSLAVSALLQCLASNCCEAGLSISSPAGSRSGLGVWCWMLAS